MKNKNNKKENNEINNRHIHRDTCNDCVLEQHYSYKSLVDDLFGICLKMIYEEDRLWYDDVISALDRVKTHLIQEESEMRMQPNGYEIKKTRIDGELNEQV